MINKLSDNILVDTDKNCFAVLLPKDKTKFLKHTPYPYEEQTDGVVGYMPTNLDACRFIYQLGETNVVKALPIYYDNNFLVEGQYKPMEHQRLTAAFMCLFHRCYILSDCRLGKTGSAIMAMDYLQNIKAITGAALIITTLTTVNSVWVPSLQSSCPTKSIVSVHGKKDIKLLTEPHDFYVTNYDSIRTNSAEFIKAIKNKRIEYILVDELTHCGNISTQRTKAISKLINTTGINYAAGMTGTPGSNPEPIYAMCKTINPEKFPYRTKLGWLAVTTIQYGPYSSQRVNTTQAPKLIYEAMQPAIRFKKEDVLDLPPVVEQIRLSGLLPSQEKAIAALWADALAELQTGQQITAANAAVRLNKILQVAQGFALDENGTPVLLIPENFSDPRSQTILEAVKETERKVVIFSMFRKRLSLLEQLLNQEKISCAVIHGGITGNARAQILRNFKEQPDPHVLIAHPTTVGYGTELSVADTLIIDGPLLLGDFSYRQTLERLSSIKQQSTKISVIKIAGDEREVSAFKRMDKEQQRAQIIAALFEEARKALYG